MNDQTSIQWKALSPEAKGATIRPLIQTELLSYSQIARRLGATRSAIAAAADRHRIISPLTRGASGAIGSKGGTANKARTPKNPKVKQPRPERLKMSRIAPTQPAGFPDDLVDKTPIKKGAWSALPGTTPIPLDRLTEHACKWPIGESPTLFCGLHSLDGKHYCERHNAIAFKPREARKG